MLLDKKKIFIEIREIILKVDVVDVKMFLRFVGKCVFMVIVILGVKLYIWEVNFVIL